MRKPKSAPTTPPPEPNRPHMVGYARVSTDDQNLDLQLDALTRAGVAYIDIYQEKISGLAKKRPEFQAMMRDLQRGDILVVWKLDRLGRSMLSIKQAVDSLHTKGATIRSLTEGFDTTTAMGTFYMHMLAAMAEFEVARNRERTRAGLVAAAERGRKGGRRETYTEAQIAGAAKLVRQGATLADAALTVRDKKGNAITVTRLRARLEMLKGKKR